VHHLFSELEVIYCYLQERRRTVVDIRESWPVFDIDSTLRICAEFRVPHAYAGPFPAPFTLDFLITEQIGDQLIDRAASINTSEEACNPDVQRTLAVQHRWCELQSVRWTLVDTSRFTKTMLETLRALRGWFRHRHSPDRQVAERFAGLFLALYERNVPLTELIQRVASRMRLRLERAEDVFRYCGWIRSIPVDLDRELSMSAPLILDEVRSD
jgi:hypothetical protein